MLSLPKKYFIVVTAAALLTSGCAAQPGPAPVVNTTKQVVALDMADKPAVQRDGTGKPVLPGSAVLPDNPGAAFVQAKTVCTNGESHHSFVLMPKQNHSSGRNLPELQ